MDGYNGWKNRQTWNIALWINNDESLYRIATGYVKQAKRISYISFVKYAGLQGTCTPDRIKFDGSRLDYKALTEMLKELL